MKTVVATMFIAVLTVLPMSMSGQETQASVTTIAERPYLLGTGDLVSVLVLDVDEFKDKSVRVDESGNISLPFLGRTEAAGLTTRQLETVIASKLSKYVVQPSVVVSLAEKRTAPVTLSGAVKTPGVMNLPPGKTLFEVLAMAGGVLPDAGYRVRLTRRVSMGEIPITGAKPDQSGQYFVVDVPLKDLDSGSSSDNIPILANDVISVPKAELIYIIGDVKRSGAFALPEGLNVSVLQAIGMAEGTLKTAATSKATIKRVAGEDKRVEIPVNIDKIMSGKSPDVQLQAKDMLVIPGSASQSMIERTISTILTIGTGAVIRLY